MHPLDLLKVKFQTSTEKLQGGIGRQIYYSLRDIHASQGWRGLYRGVGANVAGNASSWGLYFLLYVHYGVWFVLFLCYAISYNMLKKSMSPTGDPNYKFSSTTTLLYAAEASSQFNHLQLKDCY